MLVPRNGQRKRFPMASASRSRASHSLPKRIAAGLGVVIAPMILRSRAYCHILRYLADLQGNQQVTTLL